MLHCRGFESWISIDGTEAPEYGVEVSKDRKSVSCWIASQLGKKFSVHWTNTSYKSDVRGRVYMDGILCGGKIIHPNNLPTTATKNGITNGVSVKPFMFSSLQLTDDDAFLERSLREELGLIEIKIEPVQVTERVRDPTGYSTSLPEIKAHERSRKAFTEQITVAEPEFFTKRLPNVRCEATGPELVKFIFKYRTHDVLCANGILPAMLREEVLDNADTPEKMCQDTENAQKENHFTEKKPRVKDDLLERKEILVKDEPPPTDEMTVKEDVKDETSVKETPPLKNEVLVTEESRVNHAPLADDLKQVDLTQTPSPQQLRRETLAVVREEILDNADRQRKMCRDTENAQQENHFTEKKLRLKDDLPEIKEVLVKDEPPLTNETTVEDVKDTLPLKNKMLVKGDVKDETSVKDTAPLKNELVVKEESRVQHTPSAYDLKQMDSTQTPLSPQLKRKASAELLRAETADEANHASFGGNKILGEKRRRLSIDEPPVEEPRVKPEPCVEDEPDAIVDLIRYKQREAKPDSK